MKKAFLATCVLVGVAVTVLIANFYLYVLPISRGLNMLYPGLNFSHIRNKNRKYIKVERN